MSSPPVSTASTLRRWLSRGHVVIWPVIEQFAWPLSQVLLAYELLTRMGAAAYGLWLLSLSFIFAAPMLSFGRSMPLLVLIPRLHSRGLPTTWLLRRVLAQVAWTAPALLAMALLGAALWPHALSLDRWQLALYVALTVAMLTVTEVDTAFAYALKGHGRFQAAALCEVAGRALQVTASLLLIGKAASVFMLMAVALGCMALKAALKAMWLMKSIIPDGPPSDTSAHVTASREMSQLGLWQCVQVASALVFLGYDRWIVGYAAGAAAVAAYGICSQYVQLGYSLAAAATLPLVPWVSRRLKDDGSVADAAQVRAVAATCAVLAALPILLAGSLAVPVLSLWIGPEFAHANQALVERLALAFAVLALSIPFTNMLTALRHGRFAALLSVAASAVLLLASWIWPPADGLAMAGLKMTYSVVVLISVWKLLQCLRPSRR